MKIVLSSIDHTKWRDWVREGKGTQANTSIKRSKSRIRRSFFIWSLFPVFSFIFLSPNLKHACWHFPEKSSYSSEESRATIISRRKIWCTNRVCVRGLPTRFSLFSPDHTIHTRRDPWSRKYHCLQGKISGKNMSLKLIITGMIFPRREKVRFLLFFPEISPLSEIQPDFRLLLFCLHKILLSAQFSYC